MSAADIDFAATERAGKDFDDLEIPLDHLPDIGVIGFDLDRYGVNKPDRRVRLPDRFQFRLRFGYRPVRSEIAPVIHRSQPNGDYGVARLAMPLDVIARR